MTSKKAKPLLLKPDPLENCVNYIIVKKLESHAYAGVILHSYIHTTKSPVDKGLVSASPTMTINAIPSILAKTITVISTSRYVQVIYYPVYLQAP